MRIIFVPQFPSEMRYQAWWFTEFPKQFRDRGVEVLTLGESHITSMKYRRSELDMFSPINQAIEFEMKQIKEYMMLDIKEDDILFVADISFPGIFCSALYHKECPKSYTFCHATSLNKYDYFENTRYSKFLVETAYSRMFDTVFVGSEYHKDKLHMGFENNIHNWVNTKVTYLPFQPPFLKAYKCKKTIDIMSASRPSPQKVDSELETWLENKTNIKIERPISNTWGQYSSNLQKSKMLLITAFEDTFGYQIVDAITNGCIPIARNSLAYPELLPREYLYETKDELLSIVNKVLNSELPVPELICEEQMNKFYDVICDEMIGEVDYPF